MVTNEIATNKFSQFCPLHLECPDNDVTTTAIRLRLHIKEALDRAKNKNMSITVDCKIPSRVQLFLSREKRMWLKVRNESK